ncbi:MAG: hypothetical protein LBK76_08590 [Verrucomicrobiales bacterium]|jgi:hypothetical protein|nr:hypothetical protein [Verrucomicrobiales bacterium]
MQIRQLLSLVVSLLLFLTVNTARAERVLHYFELPLIVPAAQPMPMDGDPAKWRGLPEYNHAPLWEMLRSNGEPLITKALAAELGGVIRLCYDDEALYISVAWRDFAAGTNRAAAGDAARWDAGGEGFELHLKAGDARIFHLASWPSADGKALSVAGRHEGAAAWQDLAGVATAAGRHTGADRYFQEVRLPWRLVTGGGKPAASEQLWLGVDLVYNALPQAAMLTVKQAMIDTALPARGTPLCFLTAEPPKWNEMGIFNPAAWGALTFGAADGGGPVAKNWWSYSLRDWTIGRPAAAPVIDGDAAEWAPAAWRELAYIPGFYGDRFAGRVAMSYDADNLYLAGTFTCFGQIANLKTEATQAGFGGGDNLQIRLFNGKKKVNLCAWLDSSTGQPVITADGVDLPNPFLLRQGARAAFQLAPDKKSYTLELALPWKELLGAAPAAGDQIQFSLQPWWADLHQRYSIISVTGLKPRGALDLPYQMPRDAELSLGVFKPNGELVRWLGQSEFRAQGAHSAGWDGLDQWGEPAAAGDYLVRGVWHAPLSTEYLATVNNPGTPPWPTADDRGDWLGDEANPQAAATDGDWVYLSSPGAEYGSYVIAVDGHGQRQWGLPLDSTPRRAVLAVEGDYVYLLNSGPIITDSSKGALFTGSNAIGRTLLTCVEKSTGKLARFSKEIPKRIVAKWPYKSAYYWMWELRNNQAFTPAVNGGQPRYASTDVSEGTNSLGLAVVGDKLYIGFFDDDQIAEYDAVTAQPTGVTVSLPAPVGLHKLDAKTLLAVSGTQVVKVDLPTRQVTPFIVSGLVAPFAVTTGQDGSVYVSDWKDSFQVKQFSADGQFVKAIGKPGGRPWVGPWEPDGMLVPSGIAVTASGRLWVTEDDGTPRRVSVWDTASGALVRDYIGPTAYGGGGYFWIDPKDPTLAMSHATRFKVDYATKKYTPLAVTWRRHDLFDCFVPNAADTNGPAAVRYHGQDEYVAISHNRGVLGILKREGELYHQVAAFGWRGPNPVTTGDGTYTSAWDSDIGYHAYPNYYPEFFKGHNDDWLSWADADGDRRVSAQEMQWQKTAAVAPAPGAPLGRGASGWSVGVGWDLSIYFVAGHQKNYALYRLSPEWKNDVPHYDLAKARFLSHTSGGAQQIYVTRDGKVIVSYSYEYERGKNSFEAYDADSGQFLWALALPGKLEGHGVHATGAIYDYEVPGLGNVVLTWNWHGNVLSYLFTTDGDYIGAPLAANQTGPHAAKGESFRGGYQFNGEQYIINGASQMMHILKLHGLEPDQAGKFQFNYQLTEDAARRAAAGRDVAAAGAPAAKPAITVSVAAKPPVIDGQLDDWNLAGAVNITRSEGRSAEVALARDAGHLYLAYKVWQTTPPLRNGGTDWQKLFITGDCVDLMLQSDAKADPARTKAAAGDERLVLSVLDGEPVAVRYRPVSPGAKSPAVLLAAHLDEVIKLPSAKIAVQRNEKEGWYVVEAAIPLSDLGVSAAAGDVWRGDVGVIFADVSGRNRALRAYYYNQKTTLTEDLTTEATLQPAEWGELRLEK